MEAKVTGRLEVYLTSDKILSREDVANEAFELADFGELDNAEIEYERLSEVYFEEVIKTDPLAHTREYEYNMWVPVKGFFEFEAETEEGASEAFYNADFGDLCDSDMETPNFEEEAEIW